MSYETTKRHGGILMYAMEKKKDANLKSLHTAWFLLYDLLGKVNYGDSRKINDFQRLVGGGINR